MPSALGGRALLAFSFARVLRELNALGGLTEPHPLFGFGRCLGLWLGFGAWPGGLEQRGGSRRRLRAVEAGVGDRIGGTDEEDATVDFDDEGAVGRPAPPEHVLVMEDDHDPPDHVFGMLPPFAALIDLMSWGRGILDRAACLPRPGPLVVAGGKIQFHAAGGVCQAELDVEEAGRLAGERRDY